MISYIYWLISQNYIIGKLESDFQYYLFEGYGTIWALKCGQERVLEILQGVDIVLISVISVVVIWKLLKWYNKCND